MKPGDRAYTPLELAIATSLGVAEWAPQLPAADDRTPREALEEVVGHALRRPPCLVSFSGGRDSSVILALAAHVARRDGLALPIPATNVFPQAPETDEDAWQHLVVKHLALPEWERLPWTDELDLLGPLGARMLRRIGVRPPMNLHFHEPIAERAAGGALLTGIGGDELFHSPRRARAVRLVYGRRWRELRHPRSLAYDLLPAPARAWVVRRDGLVAPLAWLRPAIRAQILEHTAAREHGIPLRWDGWVNWWWRQRMVQCQLESMRALGAAYNAVVSNPFEDPAVLAAFAAHGASRGPGPRAQALTALVGDLLPLRTLQRATKASFETALYGERSRAFAQSWTGEGVDPALVDPEALRAEWGSPQPAPQSFALLQQAWLSADRRRSAAQ